MQSSALVPYQHNKGDLTLKEKLLFGLIGAAGAALTVSVIIKAIKQQTAKKSDAKSFEIGSAASYAKQISSALANKGWFGVDMNIIRNVYRQIKDDSELKEVQREYRRQNGNRELNSDLSRLLTSHELNELLQIMAGKTAQGQPLSDAQYKAWANRINAAINYRFGTDEDALMAVFLEIPTQAAYAKVEQAYYTAYGVTMKYDLAWDLEFWELPQFKAIIASKPIA